MDHEDRAFLTDFERSLAAAWRLLAHREHYDALWCVTHGTAELGRTHFDNWNGGTTTYTVTLRIDPGVWVGMQGQTEHIGQQVEKAVSEVAGGWENQVLGTVQILPAMTEAAEGRAWRITAAAVLDKKPVNNQGRIRSDALAPYEYRGLRFRSPPEIELFRAFERLPGVLVAPLPAVVVGGAHKRFEPDFLVFLKGKAMIVEVDGATTHPENVTAAHDRIAPAMRQNIHVERVEARRCTTQDGAAAVAEDLIRVLDGLAR